MIFLIISNILSEYICYICYIRKNKKNEINDIFIENLFYEKCIK